MNNEIKEILEDVKRHLDYVDTTKQSSIRDNEMKVMYDYITNLQNIIKEVKEYIENTTYADITGLEKHSIKEFWFVKELLEILDKEK